MLTSTIQLLAIFIIPALIMKYRNNKLTRLFGAIGMAYLYGILVAIFILILNLNGIDFSLNSDIGEVGSYAAIGIAIPLLLFSSNLAEIKKLTKTVLLSFASLIVSVIFVATAANYFFGRTFEWGREISAMSVGLYTGGTPNLNAIGVILGVQNDVIAIANLSDMIFGAIFYIFILLLAKPLLLKLLGRGQEEKYMKKDCDTTNVDTIYNGAFNPRIVKNTLLALLCVVVGAGMGMLIWLLNGSVEGTMIDYLVPGIMVTVTVLGIAFSFIKRVREVRENNLVGVYLILVFSFALASSINLSELSMGFYKILLLLSVVTVGTFIVHMIISKFLRIGADCTIITLTAGLYGPAFIPPVAAQLKNEKLIAPGLICGAVGYIIGTFLGVLLFYIY